MKKSLFVTIGVLALAGAMAGCETETPYQPLAPGQAVSGGYSDVKLEADRWRVSFQGNSLTSRQTVENDLLYRAAELTLAQGYDWFEMVNRDTDKHTETYVDPLGPVGPIGPYGYGWRPYWRYYGGGFGWRGWDPFWGDPFWADRVDVQTIEKYEASAEIVMGHGSKPAGDRRAFNAREVTANLSGHLVRPH
jgi:hypothetical protein